MDVDPQDQAEEEGANVDLDSQRKGKCAVIKTSTRQVNISIILFLMYDIYPLCTYYKNISVRVYVYVYIYYGVANSFMCANNVGMYNFTVYRLVQVF